MPIDTDMPAVFEEKERNWPNYFLVEPALHFGVRFLTPRDNPSIGVAPLVMAALLSAACATTAGRAGDGIDAIAATTTKLPPHEPRPGRWWP